MIVTINKLKGIVETTDTSGGKTFDLVIQFLIIISLITFSIDTLPDLSQTSKDILRCIEVIIVSIFTLEYILRIFVAAKKFSFIFSFYGIIDLAAIAPFYFVTGLDLRSIRIFRLLRLLRVFKLFRYSEALNRFRRVVEIAKEEIVLFFFASLTLLYLSAVGIYYFENTAQPEQFKSIFHSLWWAVATLTTVGYGDIYPITVGGQIFTFFILMIGLGTIAVPAGLVSSALSQARKEEIERKK